MTGNEMLPFHQSIAVRDLTKARAFYVEFLGCKETRHIPDERIEFNFYGHHVVAHLSQDEEAYQSKNIGKGGTPAAPIRHFGVVVPMDKWTALADKIRATGFEFVVAPQKVFKDKLEQAIMMVSDGCGNAVEFKGIREDVNRVFVPQGEDKGSVS